MQRLGNRASRNMQISLRHQEVDTLKSRPAHDFHLRRRSRLDNQQLKSPRPIPISAKGLPEKEVQVFLSEHLLDLLQEPAWQLLNRRPAQTLFAGFGLSKILVLAVAHSGLV